MAARRTGGETYRTPADEREHMQRPPEAVPTELFCATGRNIASVPEHEEFLIQQHEAGSLRIHDRGRHPGASGTSRRWRVSWERAGNTVDAALAFDEEAELLHAVAHHASGWGADSVSPMVRLGIGERPLRDAATGIPLTGSVVVGRDLALPDLIESLRTRANSVPVLVRHVDPAAPTGASTFRTATTGNAAVVLLSDAEADRLWRELPESWGIPPRGGRLFLPQRVLDEPSGLGICEDGADAAWREAVVHTLRAARHAPPDSTSTPGVTPREIDTAQDFWSALLSEDGYGERVAESAGHGRSPGPGSGKTDLRQRTRAADEEIARLRTQLSEHERARTETDLEIDASRGQLTAINRSRKALAGAVLRLRAERDAAREDLANTSVGIAAARERDARRLVRRQSAELRAREAELAGLRRKAAWLGANPAAVPPPVPEDPGELPGIRLGQDVTAELAGLDAGRLRRSLAVLAALSEHARAPSGSAAEHLRSTGTSSLLLGSSSGAAVTFPVPSAIDPAGWSEFRDHVLLDHSGREQLAMYYLDDTAGETGAVHIGYIGPVLPEARG
ncbi:hypothetical protein [Parasphingorhabdus pacifica]